MSVLNITVYPFGTPVLSQPARTSPTQFGFNLSGSLGTNYTVQASTNLSVSNWFTALVVSNLPGNFYFIQDNQATNKQRGSAAAADGLPIYLRLLHATIGDSIAWKCRRLSLGRTALEPKAALGAKPEPMSIWLRHRVPAINWVVRGILAAVPHDEPPERNPFKSAS